MIKIWTKNTQDLCTEVVSIASELWVPTFDPHPHVMLHLEDSIPLPDSALAQTKSWSHDSSQKTAYPGGGPKGGHGRSPHVRCPWTAAACYFSGRLGWLGKFFPKAITGLQLSRESTGQLQRASPNLPRFWGPDPLVLTQVLLPAGESELQAKVSRVWV